MPTSTDVRSYHCFIDGTWRPAADGATRDSYNPYTGQRWATVAECTAGDAAAAVHAARAAFDGPWRQTTAQERARLLRRLGDLVERDAERLAVVETTDNGKLLKEMRAQASYTAEWFRYYASAIETLEGSVVPADRPNFLVYTSREPVGVVAAITPWNSPLLLLAWKVAPALAAGCTVVAKPSEYTPASTLELARLIEEAGFPKGVFNVVTGGAEVGAALVEHPDVDKVAFTGATDTGARIGATAMANHARVTLELGGKSPNVVFADADLDAAVNGVLAGIFAASGQSCMAGSRLLVADTIHDELVARVADRVGQLTLGDPMDPGTHIGPVANEMQRDKIRGFISRARAAGATLVHGGDEPAPAGPLFVRPTILTGVKNHDEIVRDEVFGPVLAVLPFADEGEAVALANDTRFGLAAAVWTRDVHRAHRVARQIRAGTVWINAYRVVSFNTPFGGFGHSGQGRENGREALHEYTETKSVWVELSGDTRDPFTIG
ncbi:aldehyde dehydrogenase [Phytoactinopolyspora limicola]|uniref:aldehyde dehydrogenase n=1 Tax=Phytoactinopolyspora limicola TaxID=2715536 RepID=UPI00140A00D7|nr:aldehyde dehydrogenase [Phytoactinopolyspora limicola]